MKSGCDCQVHTFDLCSPKRGTISQEYQGIRVIHSLRESTICHTTEQPWLETNGLIISTEKVNHVDCKYQQTPRLMANGDEGITPCKSNFCSGTMIIKTGPTNNVLIDCNDKELVHNTDERDTAVTTTYIDLNPSYKNVINPEEETCADISKAIYSNGFNLTSQERSTNVDFILNEEPTSKGTMPFMSFDDGTTRNESTVGISSRSGDSKNFNYSSYSLKTRIVGSSDLASTYCETSRAHKPQDHLPTLPHPSHNDDRDSPVKKPIIGIALYLLVCDDKEYLV